MMHSEFFESRRHSSPTVPYSYYESMIPDYFIHVSLHWHSEWEMNHILTGCSEFICGDDRFLVHAGDIILTPANMLHAVYPHQGQQQRYDTLVFSPKLLGTADGDRCTAVYLQPLLKETRRAVRITPEHPRYPEIQHVTAQSIRCARAGTPREELLLKSTMLHLFYLLDDAGLLSRETAVPPNRSELIRPALEYIRSHYREPLSIADLAREVHLSESYFMSCFRRTVGVSALEYIVQLRIRVACELLMKSDRTTLQIALESGFSNVSNFNRHFLRIMGCTPGEYRRKHAAREAE